MRSFVLALTAAGLLAVPAARAQDDAKAVIEKAVKAHGGAEVLNKFKAGKAKVKGVLLIMGQEIEVGGDTVFLYPDKAKAVLQLSVNGMKIGLTQIINGDKVEVSLGGMKLPLTDEQLSDARMSQYVSALSQLTPLLSDKAYELKALGESKFEGKALAGVAVKHKKFKEVKLFFDKTSGLLVKIDHMTSEEGKEMLEEQIFSDFKEFSGLKLATKETVIKDGKKSQEIVTEEFKPLEKVDEKEFKLDD
jgi:hypothetical protein